MGLMKNERISRDPLKQNGFKKELNEESIKIYGDIRCYASHKPYKGLIASHIKPYKICVLDGDEYSQFNINNGLLLSKQIDDYFDKVMLTFDNDGKPMFSNEIPDEIIDEFKSIYLDDKVFNDERKAYMSIHRSIFLYKYYCRAEQKSIVQKVIEQVIPSNENYGIYVYKGNCVIQENGYWVLCPPRKVKDEFVKRTGTSFSYSNADLLGRLQKDESYVVQSIPEELNMPHGAVQLQEELSLLQENSFKINQTNYDIEEGNPSCFLEILNKMFRNQKNHIAFFRKCLNEALVGRGSSKCVVFYGDQDSINLIIDILKRVLGSYIYEYQNIIKLAHNKTPYESIPNCRILLARINNRVIENDVYKRVLDNTFFDKTVLNINQYVPFYISSRKQPGISNSICFRFQNIIDNIDIDEMVDKEGGRILYWLVNTKEIESEFDEIGLSEEMSTIHGESVNSLINDWLLNNCIVSDDMDNTTRATALYENYSKYARLKGQTPNSSRKFFLELGEKLNNRKKRDSIGMIYLGIKLKEPK